MPQANDPGGYEARYQRQLELLNEHEANIHPEDARKIRDYNYAAMNDKAASTRGTRLSCLRTLSELAIEEFGMGLTEMDEKADFTKVQAHLESEASEGDQRNKRQAARLFFDHLDRDWADEITVGSPRKTTIGTEDVLLQAEIDALMEGATNPRDKALIMTLLDTGMRLSALLSLRVSDVDFSNNNARLHVNDDAEGLKGFQGERPLLGASAYLANWFDVHPARDDDDAALFCALKHSGGGFASKRETGDPIAPTTVARQLRRLGEKVGIEKPTHPHAFRHSAVTRMIRDGVPEQQIKWMVGWKPDSTQFERYGHLKDGDHIQAYYEHYDVETNDDVAEVGKPTYDECPRCHVSIQHHNPLACPACGLSLGHNADRVGEVRRATEAARDHVVEATMAEGDDEAMKAGQAIHNTLTDEQEAIAKRVVDLIAKGEIDSDETTLSL